MPRPGPRPYECVRRAWHSDRHQPIRGSIIRQIFRIVTEIHSSTTKENREWQEKLPTVVLKAEEIMYSKANSEAEYMDLETLWDRVNDAINTIIRRDESTETGKLLPPCVEAALILGCVPIRASRSQRHNNPRIYLNPRTQGHAYRSPGVSCNYPPSHDGYPSNYNQFIPVENDTSLNLGRVYPLYYGTHFQSKVSPMSFQNPENPPVIVGTPAYTFTPEPAQMSCTRNIVCSERDGNALNRINQSDCKSNFEKRSMEGCDLSLRLGPSVASCMSKGKGLIHDADNLNPSISPVGRKSRNLSSATNKEFSFFPVETAKDPLEFGTRRTGDLNSQEQNAHSADKKHKVLFTNNLGDGQFLRQLETTSSQFSSRMKWPDYVKRDGDTVIIKWLPRAVTTKEGSSSLAT